MPDFTLEQSITGPVCGLDEVGRGPLAGPVVAACVYIPEESYGLAFIAEIKDSKKLSQKKLAMLYEQITAHFSYGIAEISPQEVDQLNILQASLRAMEMAFEVMSNDQPPHPTTAKAQAPNPSYPSPRRGEVRWGGNVSTMHALIDGNHIPKNLPCPATAVIKGDSKSTSIAAASILAKYTRDNIMRALGEEFPYYGWASNVGYPSQQHRDAIDEHGITEHHRKTFAPVRRYLETGSTKPQSESGSGSEARLRA
jgi:ribonuclease HII